jgi:hypothetical protein
MTKPRRVGLAWIEVEMLPSFSLEIALHLHHSLGILPRKTPTLEAPGRLRIVDLCRATLLVHFVDLEEQGQRSLHTRQKNVRIVSIGSERRSLVHLLPMMILFSSTQMTSSTIRRLPFSTQPSLEFRWSHQDTFPV